jgi:hypothetical protein
MKGGSPMSRPHSRFNVHHQQWSSLTSLLSNQAAIRELGLKPNHRQHKGLNNQAELSHQWTRLREKKMRRKVQIGKTGTEVLVGGIGDLSTITAQKT